MATLAQPRQQQPSTVGQALGSSTAAVGNQRGQWSGSKVSSIRDKIKRDEGDMAQFLGPQASGESQTPCPGLEVWDELHSSTATVWEEQLS